MPFFMTFSKPSLLYILIVALLPSFSANASSALDRPENFVVALTLKHPSFPLNPKLIASL